MSSFVLKWSLLVIVSLCVIVIDQLAKAWIVATVALGETLLLLPALHPYLQITHTTNTGIAFGIGIGGTTFVMILSLLIVAGLLVYFSRSPQRSTLLSVGLGLVIGGALGNVIDRIQYGAVIDFVHVVIPGLVSNVSNFADHAIVLGVGVLFLESWLQDRKQKQQSESVSAESVDPLT